MSSNLRSANSLVRELENELNGEASKSSPFDLSDITEGTLIEYNGQIFKASVDIKRTTLSSPSFSSRVGTTYVSMTILEERNNFQFIEMIQDTFTKMAELGSFTYKKDFKIIKIKDSNVVWIANIRGYMPTELSCNENYNRETEWSIEGICDFVEIE